MQTPVSKPGKANWTEVIPHRDDVLLEGIEIFKDYLALQERKNGLSQIRVKSWSNPKDDAYIDFGEEAYTAYIGLNPDFDSKELRYGYSSLTTPYSTYEFNMQTKERELLKREEVVGDFDPSNYEAKTPLRHRRRRHQNPGVAGVPQRAYPERG